MYDVHRIQRQTFFGLLIIFFLYAVLVNFKLVLPLIRIELFALILGVVGWLVLRHGSLSDEKLPFWLFWVGLGFLVFTRIYWYAQSPVPLGYDPGWYKFAFDHPFLEEWTKGVFPLPFLVVGWFMSLVLGSSFLVHEGVLLLSILLGIFVYFLLRKFVGKDIALVSFLLYCTSFTLYKMFWFNYIKNILGIGALFLALMFLQRRKRWPAVVAGGLLAGIHQPAALLFGIVFFLETAISFGRTLDKDALGERVMDGILIVAIMFMINFDRVYQLIVSGLFGVASSFVGEAGGGTFFSLGSYWNYAFLYLPFAVIGFLVYYRKNLAYSLGFLVTFVFVFFELFFHKRLIIYLDAFLLVFAAVGLLALISTYRKIGITTLWVVLVLSAFISLLCLEPHSSSVHSHFQDSC